MSKTLCVIPARGGSKGIPLKNLAPLNGKPLLHYALTAALEAHSIDQTVVSSEDPRILAYADEYGRNISLPRPTELATDDIPTQPVAMHALESVEGDHPGIYNVVIVVQATMPFVSPEDIDATVGLLRSTGADSCVTVVRTHHLHPTKLKRLEGDRLVPYLEDESVYQRQDLPPIYVRNSSCYAVTSDILRSGSLYGSDTRAVEVPAHRYVDIDSRIDLEFAQFLMLRRAEIRD